MAYTSSGETRTLPSSSYRRINYIEDIFLLQKLIIEKFDIEIICSRGDRSGCSYYSAKFFIFQPLITINIHRERPHDILAILAHELGHHLDRKNEKWYWRMMFNAGMDFKSFRPNFWRRFGALLIQKSILHIILREQAAWDLGFQFLRDNGFIVDLNMENAYDDGMRWYREQGNF
jgi:hypothetical protein